MLGVEHLPHVILLSCWCLFLLLLNQVHSFSSLHSDLVVFIFEVLDLDVKFLVCRHQVVDLLGQCLFLIFQKLDLMRVLFGPWPLGVLREAIGLQLVLQGLDLVFEVFLLGLEVKDGLSLISHFLLQTGHFVFGVVVVDKLGLKLALLLSELGLLIFYFLFKLVDELVAAVFTAILKPLVFVLKTLEGVLKFFKLFDADGVESLVLLVGDHDFIIELSFSFLHIFNLEVVELFLVVLVLSNLTLDS